MAATIKYKTDWAKCCLCQQQTKENLRTPQQDGYKSVAEHITTFQALNAMPIKLDPTRLDKGDGIEETLIRNKAQYHHLCQLKFSNSKLERAKKRPQSNTTDDQEESKIKVARSSHKPSACFICEEEAPSSTLRQAMTMQLDERLPECAKTLNNGKLLAKLSGGDVVAQEFKYHPRCLTKFYNDEKAALKKQTGHEKTSRYVSHCIL